MSLFSRSSDDPPKYAEADGLVGEMISVGPRPDAFTFSILLKAYNKGEEIVEHMVKESDLCWDTALVNTALDVFIKGGKLKKALDFFEAFKNGTCDVGLSG